MAKLTSSTILLFLLATFVSCVFTLPLLQRDNGQLEIDLQLVSGDISILYNGVTTSRRISIPQSERLPSQFELTNNDLQRCIDDLHKIESIESADAAIILRIIEDFQPKLTGVLDHLQWAKSYYKRLHLASDILGQVEALQSGMANLMGKLARALPIQFQGEATTLQANMGAEFYRTVSIYSS